MNAKHSDPLSPQRSLTDLHARAPPHPHCPVPCVVTAKLPDPPDRQQVRQRPGARERTDTGGCGSRSRGRRHRGRGGGDSARRSLAKWGTCQSQGTFLPLPWAEMGVSHLPCKRDGPISRLAQHPLQTEQLGTPLSPPHSLLPGMPCPLLGRHLSPQSQWKQILGCPHPCCLPASQTCRWEGSQPCCLSAWSLPRDTLRLPAPCWDGEGRLPAHVPKPLPPLALPHSQPSASLPPRATPAPGHGLQAGAGVPAGPPRPGKTEETGGGRASCWSGMPRDPPPASLLCSALANFPSLHLLANLCHLLNEHMSTQPHWPAGRCRLPGPQVPSPQPPGTVTGSQPQPEGTRFPRRLPGPTSQCGTHVTGAASTRGLCLHRISLGTP